MKVKYILGWHNKEDYLEEAIRETIDNRTESRDSEDYVYEVANRIGTLENIIINILKDLPIDKINKYLETNFEEVKWKRL